MIKRSNALREKRGNKEGSIFIKKVKKYSYYVAQIYALDKGGKRKPIQRICRTHAEAVMALREMHAQQDSNNLVFTDKTTLASWLPYVLVCKRGNLRQSTYDNYETLARVHVIPSKLGKKRIQKITTRDIQEFILDKQKAGLSASTIRKIHSILHMSFEQAVIENVIPKNPADHINLPKVVLKEVVPFDDDEVEKLLAIAKNHRLYPAIVLELGTGLRRGELLALRWSNVDFENNTITITESYVKTKAGNQMEAPKTKYGRRVISVPAVIMAKLKEHKLNTNSPEFVFTQIRDNTKPISPRHFSRIYEKLAQKAGLKTTRLHDLRHNFASDLLKNNVHPKVAQEALGHGSIQVTMNIYSHLTPTLQREAADKLNERYKAII